MRLDAHQHFWKYDKVTHSWITDEMKVIRRDFPAGDLFPLLEEAKIDGTIAVQADETLRETEYLLDLADQNNWIKAVVGWADLGSDQLEDILDQLSAQKKLRGFREVLQSKDPEYMLRKEFIRGIRKLGKRGYTYDILIFPEHLDASLQLVDKCSDQLFVIDHLAKPKIKEGEWKEWKKKMVLLAERELVHCKLSGMVTEADLKNWKPEDLQPYLEIAMELFGPKRLMFGSDWPVCLVAGEYEQVFEVVDRFTDSLSAGEKARVMGETAKEFYGIKE
jgi:L-fuconolactonase